MKHFQCNIHWFNLTRSSSINSKSIHHIKTMKNLFVASNKNQWNAFGHSEQISFQSCKYHQNFINRHSFSCKSKSSNCECNCGNNCKCNITSRRYSTLNDLQEDELPQINSSKDLYLISEYILKKLSHSTSFSVDANQSTQSHTSEILQDIGVTTFENAFASERISPSNPPRVHSSNNKIQASRESDPTPRESFTSSKEDDTFSNQSNVSKIYTREVKINWSDIRTYDEDFQQKLIELSNEKSTRTNSQVELQHKVVLRIVQFLFQKVDEGIITNQDSVDCILQILELMKKNFSWTTRDSQVYYTYLV